MPFEVACTRLLIGNALTDAPDVAVEAARMALDEFERLGARGQANAAAAFLRRLGVKAVRRGPKRFSTLTKRELEVLSLLGAGLSNPEIAARLFVSRKTVEHHVASVLAKLGLKGRAEAAAVAVRQEYEEPAI